MTTHKNLIRRQIGYQLGLLRINQHKTLHHVAKAIHLKPYVLDQIEMGMHQNWKKYHLLLNYYHCEIKLVEIKDIA